MECGASSHCPEFWRSYHMHACSRSPQQCDICELLASSHGRCQVLLTRVWLVWPGWLVAARAWYMYMVYVLMMQKLSVNYNLYYICN